MCHFLSVGRWWCGGRESGTSLAPFGRIGLRGQVINLNRLNRASQWEPEDAGIEVQLAVERTLDVLGLAETVALAREFEIGNGDAALAQDGDHLLRLAGEHDLVVEALREVDGASDPIGE